MCERIDALIARITAFFARLFGRSRTIFGNVLGGVGLLWVNLGSDLLNFNYDAFFKHEVSLVIGAVLSIFNILIRLYTTKPVNFGSLPPAQVLSTPAVAPSVAPASAGQVSQNSTVTGPSQG